MEIQIFLILQFKHINVLNKWPFFLIIKLFSFLLAILYLLFTEHLN
jgi:hypothetical protein